MVINLYLVFFTFLLGFVLGFTGLWLWNNHHRELVRFIVVILVAWLVVNAIMSFFKPDTLLLQTYSELQGWVDFVAGFAGGMLGFFFEDRYERKRSRNA